MYRRPPEATTSGVPEKKGSLTLCVGVFVVTICRNLLPGLKQSFVRQRSSSQTTAIQRNCSGLLTCGSRLGLNFSHCMAGHFCLRTVTVCLHSRSNIWRSMLASGGSNTLFCPYLSRNHWTDMLAFEASSAASYLGMSFAVIQRWSNLAIFGQTVHVPFLSHDAWQSHAWFLHGVQAERFWLQRWTLDCWSKKFLV